MPQSPQRAPFFPPNFHFPTIFPPKKFLVGKRPKFSHQNVFGDFPKISHQNFPPKFHAEFPHQAPPAPHTPTCFAHQAACPWRAPPPKSAHLGHIRPSNQIQSNATKPNQAQPSPTKPIKCRPGRTEITVPKSARTKSRNRAQIQLNRALSRPGPSDPRRPTPRHPAHPTPHAKLQRREVARPNLTT